MGSAWPIIILFCVWGLILLGIIVGLIGSCFGEQGPTYRQSRRRPPSIQDFIDSPKGW